MGIVRAMNNYFTDWLVRNGCSARSAFPTQTFEASRLSVADVNRVRDLLECGGWRTSFDPSTGNLDLTREAAPLAAVRASAAFQTTDRVHSLLCDMGDQFALWLARNGCNATDTFRHAIDIPRLHLHESDQMCDILECHGWKVDVRAVHDLRSRLSIERKASALVVDGASEARRAWLALDAGERMPYAPSPTRSDAGQAPVACGKCKVEAAAKPTKLDECGHVFCLKCITGVPPNLGCVARTSCPVCGTHFYFYCMRRLDGVPVNSHLWNARIPEE